VATRGPRRGDRTSLLPDALLDTAQLRALVVADLRAAVLPEVKGKSADTFAPLGPVLATPDEVGDPQTLDLWLTVNGEGRQKSNTKNMAFGVFHLVSYVSQFMTLLPGDVISTGTPPGVGLGFDPPIYLKAGDVVELGVDGLGRQRQQVAASV